MTDIRLEITVDEANLILEALGEQPFAKVFTVVAKIQEQAQAQLGDRETIGDSLGGPTPTPDPSESEADGG